MTSHYVIPHVILVPLHYREEEMLVYFQDAMTCLRQFLWVAHVLSLKWKAWTLSEQPTSISKPEEADGFIIPSRIERPFLPSSPVHFSRENLVLSTEPTSKDLDSFNFHPPSRPGSPMRADDGQTPPHDLSKGKVENLPLACTPAHLGLEGSGYTLTAS